MVKFLFFVWLILVLSPVYIILSFLVLAFSGWPVFYTQKRVGLNGKTFWLYKFRTMVNGAEEQQGDLRCLNEASGPVFKIRNDPRFTKIGRLLSHSGLDELPQLFNVLKGEMNFVGPRPLPISEEKKIDKKYRKQRKSIRPGIMSPWIFDGYHSLSFNDWMKSDMEYIKNRSFVYDLNIFFRSFVFLVGLLFGTIREIFHN